MIKDFVNAWEEKKEDLRRYLIKLNKKRGDLEYKDLVCILFQVVINPYLYEEYDIQFCANKIKEIIKGR